LFVTTAVTSTFIVADSIRPDQVARRLL